MDHPYTWDAHCDYGERMFKAYAKDNPNEFDIYTFINEDVKFHNHVDELDHVGFVVVANGKDLDEWCFIEEAIESFECERFNHKKVALVALVPDYDDEDGEKCFRFPVLSY